MKMMKFTKAVATGNDFVIIDNRDAALAENLSGFARKVCDRKYGVGADGLLLLERSKNADFKMKIFNSDGSEAEMCGNGSRCIALYAATKKTAGNSMTIDTIAGILNADVKGDTVKVKLTDPSGLKNNIDIDLGNLNCSVNFVDTGVPHVVYFVDDLKAVDVKSMGSEIRHHKKFSPKGTNANFVKVTGKDSISVRTYERGVEDETLACGTGSVASALISAHCEKMGSPVTVETRSGEKLKIYFDRDNGKFKNVYLEGKAKLVFEGEIKNV